MNARNGWSQPPRLGPAPPRMDPAGRPRPPPPPDRPIGRPLARGQPCPSAGFLVVTGFVLGHDDPTPGLSLRGLCTIALAAAVVVLLTIRRTAGPGPLARALFEYAVVFLLAVLVATTGINLDQAPAARQAGQHRPRPATGAGQDHRRVRRLAQPMAGLGPQGDRPPRPVLPRRHPTASDAPPAALVDQEARCDPASSPTSTPWAGPSSSSSPSSPSGSPRSPSPPATAPCTPTPATPASTPSASPACGRCCWTARSSSPNSPPSWPASCAAPAAGPS